MYSLIVNSIQAQIDLGIDTSICYCIGSGENYTFLSKINEKHKFFEEIIPLEHPRFIMQYNSKHKEEFDKLVDFAKSNEIDMIKKTLQEENNIEYDRER